ncbi:MAG: hypothetical protein SFU99_06850 [Saprospiraceae bacterium]|nr:hypothetical protein [Saprospiraceae bacterium]
MMIVVDSGSSKADWRIIGDQETHSVSTMGFNPVFHSEEYIYTEVNKVFGDKPYLNQVQQVFFYCAGGWDARRKGVVKSALSRIFKQSEIMVDHDLLGAARAAAGREPGIVCILGTGSNSCLYDGDEVTDNVTNLGYLLGDEGSGTFLGKKLIRAYFYRELPHDLLEKFEEFNPGGKSAILDKVYGKEPSNVFLASFVPFFAEHRDHPFIQKLLYTSFEEFIDRHVRKYKNHISLPVHFIGSVAFHFQQIISIVLEERAMKPGIFIQKPIDNLTAFHTSSSSTLVN